VILGDLLGENYTVAPGVQGSVTLQRSDRLTRDALLPSLEMLLRMNGATLGCRGDLWHVVPRDDVVRGLAVPQLGGTEVPLPRGYAVHASVFGLGRSGAGRGDRRAQGCDRRAYREGFTAGPRGP